MKLDCSIPNLTSLSVVPMPKELSSTQIPRKTGENDQRVCETWTYFLGWFLPRNEARCVHVRIVYIHTHLTLRCIVLHWMALHYVTSSKIKLGSSSPYQVWRVWKMKSSWNIQPLILVISSFHGVIVFMFLVKMSEITNQIDHQLSYIPFPIDAC